MGFFDSVFGGSEGSTGSFVDPNQQPFLSFARPRAVETFNRVSGTQERAGLNEADFLRDQGQNFLNILGRQGTTSNLLGFTGEGFAGEQIESLSDILNRNLQFNLGQINQQSAIGNTFGGGRQGLAQGTAIGDTQMALSAGASDILQGDLARRQLAAAGVDNFNLSQGQLRNQGALGALTQLPNQFNLSQAGFNNAFQPLSNFNSIIGNPVVLGQGSQSSTPGILGSLGGFFSGVGSLG